MSQVQVNGVQVPKASERVKSFDPNNTESLWTGKPEQVTKALEEQGYLYHEGREEWVNPYTLFSPNERVRICRGLMTNEVARFVLYAGDGRCEVATDHGGMTVPVEWLA